MADQGSDTFEFLEHEFHSGRRFVVRACKGAQGYAGHEPVGQRRYLNDYADNLPELGRFTMDVQSQHGRKARKDAEFIVRGGPSWSIRHMPDVASTATNRCLCT